MSDNAITNESHNDFVADDTNLRRVPGAENATTGHHFVAVFPKDEEGKTLGRAGDWSEVRGQKDNESSSDSTTDYMHKHVEERDQLASRIHSSANDSKN